MLKTGICYKKAKGVGLLELMLSLAIIAVLLIMATRYYQTTRQSQQVNQAGSDIQAILAAAANYTAATPGESFTITDLITAGLLPASWAATTQGSTAAATVNPWGGAYTAANSTGSAVAITATSVPTSACNSLDQLMYQNYVTPEAGKACSGSTYSATFGPAVAASGT